MYRSVFRHIQLATFAFLAMIVVALLVSAGLSYWEHRRLLVAAAQLNQLREFRKAHLIAERRLVVVVRGSAEAEAARALLDQELDRLMTLAVHPDTPVRLQALRTRLQTGVARVESSDAFVLLNQADDREQMRQAQILASLEHSSLTQLKLEMAAPLAILAVGMLLFPVARRRIIAPLDAFGRQLERLADGEFTPAPVDSRVDPFLLPLHRQFNALARRLQELEAAHRDRAKALESAVRTATTHLLEQQRNLARSERLAAAGELAASVAHELRNPLAGLQMTLANLRLELHEPELQDRVDLMMQEVGRLTRLLNQLLDSARHEPEPARAVRLADIVDEILSLNRYHLAQSIQLENRVDPALECHLPPDRLRQALLNLILNAGMAMAGRGGHIRIDAAAEGNGVAVSVSDDGPGFPREMLEEGIRPFFSTREKGTGLGLALVRRFVRDVGGSLELTNLSPHGARVTLRLPGDPAA